MQSSDEPAPSLNKEVNVELPFYSSHLRFVDGDIRRVVLETRTFQACRENALHMQHAPTGCAGSSWELPDLRHETDASAQAVVADRARRDESVA